MLTPVLVLFLASALAPMAVASTGRRVIATRRSQPLSSLGAYFMKASQDFYGETFLKTLGQRFGRGGTTQAGRAVARETLSAWGIPEDAYVMYDGSGLSRYNYVSSDAIVSLLKAIWTDESMRAPFYGRVAGRRAGRDARQPDAQHPAGGSCAGQDRHQLANVRSLSGFVDAPSGERFVFSIIANHFTAGSAAVDEVAEKALLAIVR